VPLTVAQPLPEVLETLRGRGLRRGVAPLPGEVNIPAVPTGHAALDQALSTGGWPRGALAVLDAAPGHGATSLALDSVAASQSAGGLVAWIDLAGTFDPALAARRGVQLEWLLIVRPADGAEALELAAWLARSYLIDLLVLDLDGSAPTRLDRLATLLSRSDATALLRAPTELREAAGKVAGVRVRLERQAWLAVGRDLVGLRVAASVTRHRWALAGGYSEIDLWFGEGRRIDPMLSALAVPLPSLESATVEPAEPLPALAVLSA
jgi:recA bacterial DNA recombination protein